jgi:hypothetical protein
MFSLAEYDPVVATPIFAETVVIMAALTFTLHFKFLLKWSYPYHFNAEIRIKVYINLHRGDNLIRTNTDQVPVIKASN